MTFSRSLAAISDYYTGKIHAHGESALGVDWNGTDAQEIRFAQLAKLLPQYDAVAVGGGHFTINDLGCGYGALFDWLCAQYKSFTYTGYDISDAMLATARKRHAGYSNAVYRSGAYPEAQADYTLASGIFNIRFAECDDAWFEHIKSTLDAIHAASVRGFAFNCLTSWSDKEKMQDNLYYSDPCHMFELCKRRYSRNVALLHDYNLYDYTIIVRK